MTNGYTRRLFAPSMSRLRTSAHWNWQMRLKHASPVAEVESLGQRPLWLLVRA
jgi:hypothetical protein